MENNENEIQNNSNAGNDNGFTQGSDPFANVNNNGYTQAPNNGYNMNGQPMGNPYGQPPQEQGGQGMAIAGMVLGIISLVCCCSGYFALVIGIVGFVLSLIVLVQKKPGKGMAIAGIICASIAVITILALMMIGRSVSTDELQRMLQEIQNAQ
ncbi:MAG: DUF4190 domain-containing protein [Lachnospiraceae bacterium]|jgi:hypothetical protein|nr:DUF4190 domain-containing protein [Lachnospiraceae bacterium]